MTRLTNAMKEQIVLNALKQAGINDENQAIRVCRAELAEAIRVECMGGSERVTELEKTIKKIKKLQENLNCVFKNSFYVSKREGMTYCNLGGAQVHLYFNGGDNNYDGDSVCKTPIPSDVTLTADHPLTVRFHNIETTARVLKDKTDVISAQVRGSLSSFTTIKKLLAAWPEVKELLPETVVESKPQLPAVLVKDLNKLIGLPSECES